MMPLSKYPFVVVRIGCDMCHRKGVYRLARLAARYGAEIDIDALLDDLTADCEWKPAPGRRRRPKYAAKCGAHYPDLKPGCPPPDLPPAMCELRVIEGGKKAEKG